MFGNTTNSTLSGIGQKKEEGGQKTTSSFIFENQNSSLTSQTKEEPKQPQLNQS